jgi:ABC-2 type transport system ATP-binding protein
MDAVITTDSISKYYGKIHAVDGISLSVGKGEIYGFLGLNGAGKTTTIRMMLGMVNPSSGTVYINGKRVEFGTSGNTDLWEIIGYLVEIPYSYPDLTVRENLEIIRRLRFINDTAPVDTVIERLRLGPYRDMKAKNLSKGNAQRIGIAKALMHNPEILILDEPSIGLDPAGIVEIREILRALALNHGVTIFISSHILGEISKLATRIGIIHEGRLVREADTDRLNRLRSRRLLVNTINKEGATTVLINHGYSVHISKEGILELTGEKAVDHPEIIAGLLVYAGCPPTLLKVEEEDLESFFLRTIQVNGGNG